MATQIVMTLELARAAATDAGNRNMRRAGRTKWTMDDVHAAAEEFNRLCREAKLDPWKLP